MSLNGLCSTRIKANRVISTFLFNPASSRAHRNPIEGESIGRRAKEQRNATQGLCLPCRKANGIGFCPNIPVSKLIKHITRAIEASDVALTPAIVKNR
jgi:hypothetical protein